METVKNYRDVIAEALGERLASNPHYSIRAFARDLLLGTLSFIAIACQPVDPAQLARERAKMAGTT